MLRRLLPGSKKKGTGGEHKKTSSEPEAIKAKQPKEYTAEEGGEITVQPAADESFSIFLPSTSRTVAEAKKQISIKLGCPPHKQRLFTASAEDHLADSAALGEADDCVYLLLASRDYKDIKSFDQVISLRKGSYPGGVTFLPDGRVLWVGYYGSAQIVDADTGKTEDLASWQRVLQGDTRQLYLHPGSGWFFVAATRRNCVDIFASPREYLKSVGAGAGLRMPNGVAAVLAQAGKATTGRVFVADTGNHRIVVFDVPTGKVVQRIGERGARPCHFDEPTSLEVVEEHGLLAVADRGNDRIQLLTIDGGEFVRSFGSMRCGTSGPGLLRSPNDVCVDADGNLIVYDTRNCRLAVYSLEGTFICEVMRGFFLDSGNTYSNVSCCKATGRICVSDDDNHRIALLRPEMF